MQTSNTEDVESSLLQSLRNTPRACDSLTRLSGGTANFTYRGRLISPDGTDPQMRTVIIKHATGYAASDSTFELDISRADYERTMLKAVYEGFGELYDETVYVRTPKLWDYFHPENRSSEVILVIEDYPNSLELKNCLSTYSIAVPQTFRLGHALGVWLKGFHTWANAPEQHKLREIMRGNTKMRDKKFDVNYGRLKETIDMFPGILGGCQELFEEIEEVMRKELGEGKGELIHGDFWTGNILLRSDHQTTTEPLTLLVIDWEISQISSIAWDLGQCFAELYLLTHFRDVRAGSSLITAIMAGYGKLESDMAFRVALYFGVHLIVWPCRVPWWGGEGPGGKMEACVEFGRECVGHAWGEGRGKEWFMEGPLDCLFKE